jgi:bifunctional non-homologous end joining protein LigD
MFKRSCKMGLEGVVSNVRDSRYNSGRINDWVKVTCAQREILPIAGFAEGQRFDGIYLGRVKGEELVYAGKVDHGFTPESAKDLASASGTAGAEIAGLRQKIKHRGTWVKPNLLAEIEYCAKSAAGKVRYPVFKGLRGGSMTKDAFDRWWE